jgi:hypothetical protein
VWLKQFEHLPLLDCVGFVRLGVALDDQWRQGGRSPWNWLKRKRPCTISVGCWAVASSTPSRPGQHRRSEPGGCGVTPWWRKRRRWARNRPRCGTWTDLPIEARHRCMEEPFEVRGVVKAGKGGPRFKPDRVGNR